MVKDIHPDEAKALHWVLLEVIEICLQRDLAPAEHGKEAADLLRLITVVEQFGYDLKPQIEALTPIVKKGEEAAKSPEQKLRDLLGRIERWDKTMDDPDGDGSGNGSRPPTGDDYNDLYADVTRTLKEVLKLEEK